MKNKFIWAYRLTPEEVKSVFNDCQFFFETNTLLRLFSINKDIASKIVSSISRYKTRISIPYHVAEEYHWHLIEHYTDRIASTQQQLSKLNVDTLFKEVFNVNFLNYLPEEDIPNYKKILQDFCKSADVLLRKRLDECNSDFNSMQIANSLSSELSDCILNSLSEKELENAYIEFAKRTLDEIPPGYKDKKKADSGKKRMGKTNEAGDYIIWLEILKWVENNNKHVILVTNEKKSDWIWEEHGFRIGPRWELRKEFHEASGGKLFHIINLNEFLSLTDDEYSPQELKATEEELPNVSRKNEKTIKYKFPTYSSPGTSYKDAIAGTNSGGTFFGIHNSKLHRKTKTDNQLDLRNDNECPK